MTMELMEPVLIASARVRSGTLRLVREMEGRYSLSLRGQPIADGDCQQLMELLMLRFLRTGSLEPRRAVSADLPRAAL